MKQLKDYLPLYLGCECQTPEGVLKLNAVYIDSAPVFYDSLEDYECSEIRPILRPLSDMTEEEKGECFGKDAPHIKDMNALEVFTPKQFRYLLSKHFDLFNLTLSGLAIDKTTLTL